MSFFSCSINMVGSGQIVGDIYIISTLVPMIQTETCISLHFLESLTRSLVWCKLNFSICVVISWESIYSCYRSLKAVSSRGNSSLSCLELSTFACFSLLTAYRDYYVEIGMFLLTNSWFLLVVTTCYHFHVKGLMILVTALVQWHFFCSWLPGYIFYKIDKI